MNCFFRIDCVVGFYFDDQFVQVGMLFYMCSFNIVGNMFYRVVVGVDQQMVDWVFIFF